MGYILKQYNHIVGTGENDEYEESGYEYKLNYFLNPLPLEDSNIGDYQSEESGAFKGVAVTYGTGENPYFEAGAHYYFHGVLSGGDGRKYDIKLMNDNDAEKKEQFIKTITTTSASNDILDIEFIFTPVISFNKLVFSLVGDGLVDNQLKLGLCEISLINNIMKTKLAMTPITEEVLPPILKAGIQSRPGTLLCINGEDIRLPHNGIYEIKNGVILVDFFSVVTPMDFTNEINTWKNSPTHHSFYPKDPENPNRRKTFGFTIDYLYYLATN